MTTDDSELPAQKSGTIGLLPLIEAKPFHQWMFDSIRPFVKGSTVEIASWTWTMADFFVQQGMPLYLSDYDSRNCQALKAKFRAQSLIKGVLHIDLGHADFKNRYSGLLGWLSTLLVLNGAETRQNQAVAITHAKLLLRQRGHLIMVLPAYTALYNGAEDGIAEWEKNNLKSLKRLLFGDIEIFKTRYFNMVGILGRWSSGSISNNTDSLPGQPSLFNKLVPLFQITNSSSFRHTGLSVIVIARKK